MRNIKIYVHNCLLFLRVIYEKEILIIADELFHSFKLGFPKKIKVKKTILKIVKDNGEVHIHGACQLLTLDRAG